MNQSYDLVFLLEEPSMKALLEVLLPRIIPNEIRFICLVHEGKQDLEKSIPRKLKAWNTPAKFIIIRDQDSGNCLKIKEQLYDLCEQSERSDTLIRIVCHELESWFLGDLSAVEKAFKLKIGQLSRKQNNQKYRDPDQLNSAKQELKKLVNNYQQISGAKKIGQYLDIKNLDKNKSYSFKVFIRGLKKILQEIVTES
ncbi:MAG: DUF4276 family protein [Crocosphaera sp.]|nr:DUF4276 family protein [Crocosphaera sp.]